MEPGRPPVCLSIAGSDSGGGAGIQADLKTFHAFGCFGATVLTAVTAQNTVGVRDLEGVRPGLVEAQLQAVLEDLPVAVAKTGMLFSREIIEVVARAWGSVGGADKGRRPPLVIDPVMVATSGDRLLRPDAEAALLELLPLGNLVTPNLPEAAVLLGVAAEELNGAEQWEAAARQLARRFGTAFLVKGGHVPAEAEAIDILCVEDRITRFRARRVPSRSTHGTGCTLSAGIAAGLALGHSLTDAIAAAKEFVTGAIAAAPGYGSGSGPLNHLWQS